MQKCSSRLFVENGNRNAGEEDNVDIVQRRIHKCDIIGEVARRGLTAPVGKTALPVLQRDHVKPDGVGRVARDCGYIHPLPGHHRQHVFGNLILPHAADEPRRPIGSNLPEIPQRVKGIARKGLLELPRRIGRGEFDHAFSH